MVTSYDVIFETFIRRLKNDDKFFDYGDAPPEQVAEMVNDHLNSLLDRAIDTIYSYGNPDFNFYDKDDTLQQFNGKLINQEISLLSELMYSSYMEEEINRMKAMELTFRSSELNVFSPANERKTKMEMVEQIRIKVINRLINYLSRDRDTWEYKSGLGD